MNKELLSTALSAFKLLLFTPFKPIVVDWMVVALSCWILLDMAWINLV